MKIKRNVAGWFEIPVADMNRAVKFYAKVFGFKLKRGEYESFKLAWFPVAKGGRGFSGALIYAPALYKPSINGTLVYFNAFSGDLSNELKRAEAAGGKVLLRKTYDKMARIHIAFIRDSEGNRIAIFSRK